MRGETTARGTEGGILRGLEPMRRERVIGAMVLIGLGAIFGASQLFGLGALVLPLMALFFILLGMTFRSAGLMVPGGIFLGLAVGIYMADWIAPARDGVDGGLFLLAFGVGWALIPLFAALFTDETPLWPLIPGGILALVGLALIAGGPGLTLLGMVGRLWPLVLIALGIGLLYGMRRETR